MQLENLKRWHWIVIGLLLGLGVAGVRTLLGPDIGGMETDRDLQNQLNTNILNPRVDLQALAHPTTKPAAGTFVFHQPFFEKIVVHPPLRDDRERRYWVTGLYQEPKRFVEDGKFKIKWTDKRFLDRAPTPYVPKPNFLVDTPPGVKADPNFDSAKAAAVYMDLEKAVKELETLRIKRVTLCSKLAVAAANPTDGSAPVTPDFDNNPDVVAIKNQEADIRQKIANGPTIKDYLDQLNRKYPSAKIPYRFAWNELPMVNLAIWTVGMTVVVGGIWPTLLQFLLGAGLGRMPIDEYERRFNQRKASTKAPDKKPADTALTQSDLERLRALEEELAPALAEAANRPPPAAAPPPPVAPLVAATAAEQPKPAEKPRAIKSFGATGGDFYPTEVHADPKKKP